MCSYCGCRANTVIARYSAEHDEIINAMGLLRRAASAGDRDGARVAGGDLAGLLEPHTASEERSLFAELRLDAEFTEHVDGLCAEHREIDGAFARVAEGDLSAVGMLEGILRRHIDKEENGLFPAAVIALDGPAWQRVVSTA
ncbi:MAG: hemerythrin domain-containing protein [Candidatus Nanopelagicales bacterium]|nr:hemerythrin domain-containing protein [Candidatus Nanopelagicales bacterium]MCF8536400.1 hemerythrin domain-containing protein [Candidatus Nanopelagicales bacterium]MCF8541520.1 hemerythrin domain-containing protein [Candidatus Nanopelagicales bacterium]